jgi:hypothetical protein
MFGCPPQVVMSKLRLQCKRSLFGCYVRHKSQLMISVCFLATPVVLIFSALTMAVPPHLWLGMTWMAWQPYKLMLGKNHRHRCNLHLDGFGTT